MDAYAAVLEQLREHDGRRLRTYQADGRSKFTTWLVVVARRICIDFLRRKYGRLLPQTRRARAAARSSRLALSELLGAQLEVSSLADESALSPEDAIRSDELRARLEAAIRELTHDERLLLKLRFEDDLSASAIAKLIGSPTPFHVYRKLNALLAALRARLAKVGVVSAEP